MLYVQKEWGNSRSSPSSLWYCKRLVQFSLCMFGVEWVMLRQVVKLLECWKRRFSQNDLNVVWNVISSCLMWCIWRERNARSFEDYKKTSSDLQLCFLKSLFGWILVIALFGASKFAVFCALFPCSWSCWVFFLLCFLCTWISLLPLFNKFALFI